MGWGGVGLGLGWWAGVRWVWKEMGRAILGWGKNTIPDTSKSILLHNILFLVASSQDVDLIKMIGFPTVPGYWTPVGAPRIPWDPLAEAREPGRAITSIMELRKTTILLVGKEDEGPAPCFECPAPSLRMRPAPCFERPAPCFERSSPTSAGCEEVLRSSCSSPCYDGLCLCSSSCCCSCSSCCSSSCSSPCSPSSCCLHRPCD